MKLYVGTYAKYNSGSIAGAWMDLNDYSDLDEFFEACTELHCDEYDPEFMFQDYGDGPKYLYNESVIHPEIYTYLELHQHEQDIVDSYVEGVVGEDYARNNLDEVIDEALERYIGAFDSLYEVAQDMGLELLGLEVPDELLFYIDFDTVARELNHSYTFVNGHLFCD